MKNKIVLSALLGCSVLAGGLTATAQNSNSVQDVQTYDARFNLTATPDAPKGAKGKAAIKSDTRSETNANTLNVQVQGLDAGDYTVSGTTSGGSVDLGTITVADRGNGKGKGKNSTDIDLGSTDARDITGLTISNGDGVALLTGDLGGKSKAVYNATVPLTPGEGAPEATGFAKLRSTAAKGKVKNTFLLNGSGLPASTDYTVNVDGTDVGTVTSTKTGRVLVKKLPSDLTSIGTVSLVDSNGVTAVSASF
jgi:hypothetical protein